MTPRVFAMAKYDPLQRFLSAQPEDACSLTFSQIERIIGASLPPSARRHRSWWGNDNTHVQAQTWMGAGWMADPPRLDEEIVPFRRAEVSPPPPTEEPREGGQSQVIVRKLDSAVVDALKRKAQRKGYSLEQELRKILTRAAGPERRDLIAEADRIRAMTAGPLEDSVILIRQDRDSR